MNFDTFMDRFNADDMLYINSKVNDAKNIIENQKIIDFNSRIKKNDFDEPIEM